MMKTSGFVSVWALTLVSCDAFIFNAQVHPALELAKVSTGTAFDSKFDQKWMCGGNTIPYGTAVWG